jgi:hypothetical protein
MMEDGNESLVVGNVGLTAIRGQRLRTRKVGALQMHEEPGFEVELGLAARSREAKEVAPLVAGELVVGVDRASRDSLGGLQVKSEAAAKGGPLVVGALGCRSLAGNGNDGVLADPQRK